MLFVVGFMGESPPPLGEHTYDPSNLHITYLNYASLTPLQVDRFLQQTATIAEQQEPLSVKLEENLQFYGPLNDIPVRCVIRSLREPHMRLNAALIRAVSVSEGELISRYEYSPHVSHAGEELDSFTVNHLSVIQHEGSIGNNTRNLANFSLTRN